MIQVFGPFELDVDLYELRRDGEPLKLAPKAFDVLLHLVRHRERVVPKAELLDALWPGEHVTESVLPANVNAIRKALGDERGAARFVQTVHGRGYRFIGAIEEREVAPPATAAPFAPDAAFVGRDRVMEELLARLERVAAGHGGLALLAGEPGIGKTRTAQELAAVARGRGARLLEGRCYEGEGAPAFWPWIQILRAAAAELDDAALRRQLGSGASDVSSLVPEIRARLPEVAPPETLDSEEARFRLFDSVTGFLRNLARERPLVVLLDDLHWADEPTLLLLRFLAPELGGMALLLLGAYRDVELRRTHPLAQVLAALARVPDFHRITLRGLDPDDVSRFLALAAGAPPPEDLARSVFEMTEGNPFFLQEVVRLLAAEDRLAEPVDALSLPQGVREAIGRRLDALDEPCNRLLRPASVIGAEFGVGVLEAIAGLPRAELLAGLERAKRARIVRNEGLAIGRWAFGHVLIRETLYEEISVPERIALHRRVGEVLEQIHGAGDADHLAELSYHFFQAAPGGDVDRAIDYAVRAAERARELLAFEEAVLLYERALQVLELAVPVDDARRCDLLTRLGGALRAAGRREDALRRLRAAADAARRLARGDLLARVATHWPPTLGRQMVLWNAEYRPLVEEALGCIDEAALAERARLTSALALTPPDSSCMERRDFMSRQAEALGRRSGDDEALLRALEARLWALTGPDHIEERLVVASEMLRVAQRSGSQVMIFEAREHRVRSLVAVARLADADLEIDACAALARALRLPTYHLSVARFRLMRAMGAGRLDDAEALTAECQDWSQRIDDPDLDLMRVTWLMWMLETRGELTKIEGLFESFVRESQSWVGPPAQIFVSHFYALLGNFEAARRHFDAVALPELERDEDWLMTLALGAETCADLEAAGAAAPLYELLLPFARTNVTHLHMRHYLGAGSYFLGRLAALLGRDDAAAEHFEHALAMNQELLARPALARTSYAFGRWLRRGSPRGREARRGAELLEAAGRLAREIGMRELLARVERALG